jgi:hypothetical protein
MDVSRRGFLRAFGTAVAAGALTGATAGDASAAPASQQPLALPTPFQSRVGTTYTVRSGNGATATLRLVEAVRSPGLAHGGTPMPDVVFDSLIFEGDASEALDQDQYTFDPPLVDDTPLLMVPVVPRDPARRDYQVMINRHADSQKEGR